MPTSSEVIAELLATAVVADNPPPNSGGRKTPLYQPMVQRVVDSRPKTVVFGPIKGKTDAERIRTGAASYVHDHPELIPAGWHIRFAVRASDEGDHRVFSWLEQDQDGAA
jgi:hypothetical protein